MTTQKFEYLNLQELSDFFNVSTYILRKDLKKIKDKLPSYGKRRPFLPYEVEIIKKYLQEGK